MKGQSFQCEFGDYHLIVAATKPTAAPEKWGIKHDFKMAADGRLIIQADGLEQDKQAGTGTRWDHFTLNMLHSDHFYS